MEKAIVSKKQHSLRASPVLADTQRPLRRVCHQKIERAAKRPLLFFPFPNGEPAGQHEYFLPFNPRSRRRRRAPILRLVRVSSF
jgi:hypothetical protein